MPITNAEFTIQHTSKYFFTRENLMRIIADSTAIALSDVKSLEWSIGEEFSHFFIVFNKMDLKKELPGTVVYLIEAYRIAVDEDTPLVGLPAEKLLPEKRIEAIPNSTVNFNSATFSKFADFRNTFL